jgi:hypothetical protein
MLAAMRCASSWVSRCAARARPGSTAQEARWCVIRKDLVGARQFPRLRRRAPEHRGNLHDPRTLPPCGAARVIVDARCGGPHAPADVLPQRDARARRRSDFQHCSPPKIPRRIDIPLGLNSPYKTRRRPRGRLRGHSAGAGDMMQPVPSRADEIRVGL